MGCFGSGLVEGGGEGCGLKRTFCVGNVDGLVSGGRGSGLDRRSALLHLDRHLVRRLASLLMV